MENEELVEIIETEIKQSIQNFCDNITIEEINKMIDDYYREIDIKKKKVLRIDKLKKLNE